MFRLFKIILTFYYSFIAPSTVITLSCISALYLSGLKVLPAVLFIRLAATGLIVLYINMFKKNEFYYYQNLGLTKNSLWLCTLILDMMLFILPVIIVILIK